MEFISSEPAIEKSLRANQAISPGQIFPAIVLYVAGPVKQPNYWETGSTMDLITPDATSLQQYYKIYFRVEELHGNLPLPPSFVALLAQIKLGTAPSSPSDIISSSARKSKLKKEAQEEMLISCHPSFYISSEKLQSIIPNRADIIEVSFSDNTFTEATMVGMHEKGLNNVPTPTQLAPIPVTEAFDHGPAPLQVGDFPPLSTPDEIKKLALSYDEDGTVPRKAKNEQKINAAHPEMIPYIKAFIYKCWIDLKASIRVNSTYRSPTQQQKLYDDWLAGGQVGVKPAKPGTSWHNVGGALDFNPTMSDGVTLLKKTNKEDWIASKVPALGESLGLRWGGHFKTNYDPIHFDLGKIYTNTQKKEVITKSRAQGVEPTSIEFV